MWPIAPAAARARTFGKPHGPIYDRAMAMIGELKGSAVPRSRVLAIGDGLRTDIAGAAAAGIRSVYILSGVHAKHGEKLTPELLARLFEPGRPAPIAAMSRLSW